MRQAGVPHRADVERALAEVYARPEFAPPAPSPVRAWIAERWAALWDWLGSLVPGLQVGEGGLRVLSWLVIGILAAVAVAAVLHLAGSGRGWWRSRDRAARVGPAPRPAPDMAADWDARARAAAAAGRWREAALALYQATLLRLDAGGALRYDAAKTPGDYRRELRRDPAASRAFQSFLRHFEPVAFGARTLDAPGYDRLNRLAAEVVPGG